MASWEPDEIDFEDEYDEADPMMIMMIISTNR